MDKMAAVIRMAELTRMLNKVKAMDDLQNEGAEGYESSRMVLDQIDALIDEMAKSKLAQVNGKIHDAADWAEVKAAWNAAIMANQGKSPAEMIAAAKKATGYEYDHITHLKRIFA